MIVSYSVWTCGAEEDGKNELLQTDGSAAVKKPAEK